MFELLDSQNKNGFRLKYKKENNTQLQDMNKNSVHKKLVKENLEFHFIQFVE